MIISIVNDSFFIKRVADSQIFNGRLTSVSCITVVIQGYQFDVTAFIDCIILKDGRKFLIAFIKIRIKFKYVIQLIIDGTNISYIISLGRKEVLFIFIRKHLPAKRIGINDEIGSIFGVV